MPHFSEPTLKYVRSVAFSTHPSAIHYEETLLTTENILRKTVIFKPVFNVRVFFPQKQHLMQEPGFIKLTDIGCFA